MDLRKYKPSNMSYDASRSASIADWRPEGEGIGHPEPSRIPHDPSSDFSRRDVGQMQRPSFSPTRADGLAANPVELRH